MDIADIEPAWRDATTGTGEQAQARPWHELVGALGAEIALPLTAALERIDALAATGRIDRRGLRALRAEVAAARHAGMASQQLARLASGRIRQSQERVDLAQMLAGVLDHRALEIQARGARVESPPPARPVEILIDAPLVFSLLDNLLDWALACARSKIVFRIDVKAWPVQARLSCRFAHRPLDQLDDGAPTSGESARLDSMHWRLLEQTARALGVGHERSVDADGTALVFEFSRTVTETMAGLGIVELDGGIAATSNARPLAGNHVLVVASQRELQSDVHRALRDTGLLIDCVDSIAQAADFCRDGLPHAIVIDAILCDERFAALRRDITADVPRFTFIEIAGDDHPAAGDGAQGMSRIAHATLQHTLAPALLLELSRQA